MENTEITKILSLNENNKDDFFECYQYVKNYLDEIKKSEQSKKDVLYLKAIIDKYIHFGTTMKTDINELSQDLEKYSSQLESNIIDNSLESVTDATLHQVYSNFLKIYTKINQSFINQTDDLLDFDGLIDYKITNKRKVIDYINSAIELIKDDNTLSEKSKKKLIQYLTDTIQELLNPKTNWSTVFKKTKEVIIVLSALSTLVGGVESGTNLLQAKNSIEEAGNEIVKTSIHVNHYNFETTFNISKQIEIEGNKVIMIE